MVTPAKSSASATSAPPPNVSLLPMRCPPSGSFGLAHVEHDGGGDEEVCDQHRKVDEVAHVEHTLRDGVEMRKERQRGDGIDQRLRQPRMERVDHHRIAREQEDEADDDGEDE